MKKMCMCMLGVLILLTSLPFPSKALAADYDQRFAEVYGVGSVLPSGSARSPRRSSTSDVWARVNSKTNQPRDIGTNPHQGTDLQFPAGELVYPILPGKVASVQHSLTTQMGKVVLQHDVDADGIYDNYYVSYLHIDPNGNATTGVQVGDTFTVTQSIGVIDIQRPGGFGPHLHFHRVNSSGTITYKLYNFYRWVSSWNNGSHLDFISGDAISTNTMYITAYSCTDNTTNAYTAEKVELYYKIGSSGTWTKSTTNFTLDTPSIHRWKIDLKSATGAVIGNTIYYYIVATRKDPTFSGSYKIGVWPQYYEHATAPLSSTYANTIARTHTIS